MNRLLENYEVTVTTAEVLREVGLFAEKSDISEEIVRLESHLEQFQTIMDSNESAGRNSIFSCRRCFAKPIPLARRQTTPRLPSMLSRSRRQSSGSARWFRTSNNSAYALLEHSLRWTQVARRLNVDEPLGRKNRIADITRESTAGLTASLFRTSLCCRFRRACPGGSDNCRATPGR